MQRTGSKWHKAAPGICLSLCLLLMSGPALGDGETEKNFRIPSQTLSQALKSFARQSNIQVLFSPDLVANRQSIDISGDFKPRDVLSQLLDGTGLVFRYTSADMVVISSSTSGNEPDQSVDTLIAEPGAELQAENASPTDSDKPGQRRPKKTGSKTSRTGVTEEIIVTATRRAVSLQEVGVAITSIDPSDFTDVGLSSLGDIIAYIPGINFISDGHPGLGNLNMRGVTQEGGSPIVGIYVDDVPFTSGTPYAGGGIFLFDGVLGDLERIEVVKGPQGTLFGANSVGGVIRYVTRDPAMDEVRGNASVDFSNTRNGGWNQQYRGNISFPVVEEKLGVTLSAFYSDQSGYVDRLASPHPLLAPAGKDVNDSENKGVNLAALWNVTETVSLKLTALHYETEFDQISAVNFDHPANPGQTFSPTIGENITALQPGPGRMEYDNVGLALNADLDWATLTWTAATVKFDSDVLLDLTLTFGELADSLLGDPFPTNRVTNTTSGGFDKILSELRLTSADSEKFEWLAGLFYTEEDTFNSQVVASSPGVLNLGTLDFPGSYTETSVFGNLTWYLTPDFDLTAGARFSKNELKLDGRFSGLLLTGSPDLVSIVKTVEEDVETFMFGARWRLSEQTAFYGRVASGYRPPFANLPILDLDGNDVSPPIVDSDTMVSYELGVKGNGGDGRWIYDFALWAVDWEDFQAQVIFNGIPTQANSTSPISAEGVEGTVTFYPVDALRIETNFAYTDSKLDDDEPGLGGLAGEPTRFVPEWTASLMASYEFRAAELDSSVGGGIRYISEFNTEYPNNIANFMVPESTLVDLHARLSSGHYSATLYLTNLFDSYELSTANAFSDFLTGNVIAQANPVQPRTIGINLTYRF